MAAFEVGPPDADEIADLLDQCSPEELANILATIENGGLSTETPPMPTELPEVVPPLGEAPRLDPVPPPAPPPGGGGRRAKRGSAKPAENEEKSNELSVEQLKQMLNEHSAAVVADVQKMLPRDSSLPAAGAGDTLDLTSLAFALSERDKEVQALEAKLAGLQSELSAKDQRVAELGGELDAAVREVRHRQLDLEFQQLKLEERVRTNAELEQAKRSLTARVEEASLNARHAALDAEMGNMTPRSLQAQGALPWVLRKSKLLLDTSGPSANR